MPTIRRTLKNVVKNYSDAQVKVREATSNDPWGPSSTLMSEIADLTYNVVAFTEIMQMVWKRLNDDGKNWRHVYKSLMVLDYIIKTGSEKVAQQCKENFHAVKTLTSFQYIDAGNKDQGMNVREKAKQLVALLSDDERLKNERAKALKAKERFAQSAMGIGSTGGERKKSGGMTDPVVQTGNSLSCSPLHGSDKSTRFDAGSPTLQSGSGGYADPYGGATGSGYDDAVSVSPTSGGSGSRRMSVELDHARPASVGEEELQLQLALAMSKEEHDEELRKQKSDDIKLQMALDESRKHADEEQKKSNNRTHNPELFSLADGGRKGTTDPWGMPLQQKQEPTDPWGAPLPGPGAPKTHAASPQPVDPWVSPAGSRPSQPTPPIHNIDPWGAPTVSPARSTPQSGSTPGSQPDAWGVSPGPQSSPWGSPAPPQQTAGLDPFGSPAAPTTTTNGTNNIDEAFDLLSSRSTEGSPAKSAGSSAAQAFDPLVDSSASDGAWNMGSLNQNLPLEKKKSAQDFLGQHTGLVNLDELVSKPAPKGNNPFAAPSASNPFEQPVTRVPMNQLQNTAPGFTQPVNSGLLPTPLIPVNTTHQPMQPQQQSYNPFL
ncbi:epsin-2-like isoform X3 [Haliotis rufescens]|uniref:epsin-2-like isoform X3 n=1 Tax=Haliotis rufescens TaxID=6454 RepID=UPI001EB034DD|nr:epsin-2-like isoform X3 [Haliotis rufescens]